MKEIVFALLGLVEFVLRLTFLTIIFVTVLPAIALHFAGYTLDGFLDPALWERI